MNNRGRGNGVLAGRIRSVMTTVSVGGSAVIPCGVDESRRVAQNASVMARQELRGRRYGFANVADTDAKGIRVWRYA